MLLGAPRTPRSRARLALALAPLFAVATSLAACDDVSDTPYHPPGVGQGDASTGADAAAPGADGSSPGPTSDGGADTGVPPNDSGTPLGDAGLTGRGNPDSVGFGVKKTIVIDGANTGDEWGPSTLLIRDPAADDARFLGSNWCAHEPPWDYAALHAAWDDTYLYVGIQYVNITDVIDPANLGGSKSTDLAAADLIQFLAFDTIADTGYSTGGDMWSKNHEFVGTDRPDLQLYFHSNFSQEGTYLGRWSAAQGKIMPFLNGKTETRMTGKGGHFFVGTTLPGVEPNSDDSKPGTYGSLVDYMARGHSSTHDTFFELRIPLDALGITAQTLARGTIGIFAANGDGSAVDSIPNDPATSSTPGTSQSNSPLEWDMVKDQDRYTSLFARVGTP